MSDDYQAKYMEQGEVVAREKIIGTKAAGVLAGVAAVLALSAPIIALSVPTGFGALGLVPVLPALLLATLAVTIPVLRVSVTTSHLMIQAGMSGPKIAMDAIRHVRTAGLHRARRAWGAKFQRGHWHYLAGLGVGEGVMVTYEDQGKEKKVFFSSRDPEGMVAAIRSVATGVKVRVADELEDSERREDQSNPRSQSQSRFSKSSPPPPPAKLSS